MFAKLHFVNFFLISFKKIRDCQIGFMSNFQKGYFPKHTHWTASLPISITLNNERYSILEDES